MFATNKLSNRLSNLGIKTKLASVIFFAVVVAVGSVFYPQYKQRLHQLDIQHAETTDLIANIIAAKAAAPLANSDYAAVQAVLDEPVNKNPEILAAQIHHHSDGLVAEAARGNVDREAMRQEFVGFRDALLKEGDLAPKNVGNLSLFGVPIIDQGTGESLGIAVLVWDLAPAVANARTQQVASSMRSAASGLLAMFLLLWLVGKIVTKPILAVGQAMDRVANHDYDSKIPGEDRGDELGQMAQRLAFFRDQLSEEEKLRAVRAEEDAKRQHLVHRLAQGLADLADGRVDRSIDLNEFDEGQEGIEIIHDYNQVIVNLRQILSTATKTAESVRNSSAEIAEVVIDQSKRSEAQAVTLEESSAAIETLSGSVETTAANAADAKKRILENRDQAQSGGEVVEQTVEAMKSIEASSDQITAIIGVIDDIAFQTNLLALNAGVEAARAGEAGRGFAVVASEVRALAQRASSSANEIKELITRSGEQVVNGSRLVNEAGSALHEIIDGINHASDLVSQIATSSRAQADNLAEIKEGVRDLDRVTQRNAAMVEESSAASRSLSEEANRLSETLQAFKLSEADDQNAVKNWDEDLEADALPAVETAAKSPEASQEEEQKPVLEFASRQRVVNTVNDADAWADF